ncbi:MAG: glucosaminidase domain-containing protein [Candidatus Puniceispirillaceae bacterium]
MLLLRRIENRHILWVALSMVAIGLIVPGGFGVKPPQWFHDRPPQDVASLSSDELDAADTSTSVASLGMVPKVEDNLAADRATQQAPEPDQTSPAQTSQNQASQNQTSAVTVPSKFARHIPAKHFEMTGDIQKESFIKLVLPLILAANEELLQRREAVQAAVQANDRDTLDQWAVLYRIDSEDFDDVGLAERLLRRVDTIPVALALAQAAVESGWGTSRFARQGNALFGQWAWTESAGLRPLAASNDRAVVRSFGSLLESVRAYMHNLNTHQNYKRFREARYRLKPQAEEVKASRLATYLDSYAEIGQAYVKKLLAVMTSNDFDQYAEAKLG